MTARIDHDKDIRDFVPLVEVVKKLKNLKTRRGISDFYVKDGDVYYTPIRNIDKIDLDPRKTVILECKGYL